MPTPAANPGPSPTRRSTLRLDAAGLVSIDDRGRPLAVPGPLWLMLELDADPSPAPPDRSGPLLVQSATIAATGHARGDDAPPPAELVIARPDAVLAPALANAHTHLDLTHIGPRDHDPDAGFVPWVETIIRERPTDPGAIAAAVRTGAALSLAGGVAAVGDIAGAAAGRPTLAAAHALAETRLAGTSFVEFLGIGAATDRGWHAVEALLDPPPEIGARLGLQPHAPNTTSLTNYARAAEFADRLGLPLATHLAETPEERAFVADATGPQRDLLERLGLWDDTERAHVGRGLHPVEHLAGFLEAPPGAAPRLLAHANDAPDAAIEALAVARASVAFCPRAHAAFGHARTLGPHRWADMLAAGVNVCLATDSIVSLDTPDRITPLDDARRLVRSGADPADALAMITTRPAAALGLDPAAFRLDPVPGRAAPLGLLALPAEPGLDPLRSVFAAEGPPEFLLSRNPSGDARRTHD